MATVTRISKSKIGTYETCPYNYKLCYVDNLPMPKKPWAMERGVNIHKIFENITSFIYGTRIDEAINNAIQQYPESFEPIKNFGLFQKAISQDGILVKPLFSEEKLYFPRIDTVGIIDAIYKIDEELFLIDYKSGNINELSKYYFELGIYVYLVESLKNIKINNWGIYFTDHHVLKQSKVDRQQIELSLMKINTIRQKILNDEFPKKPKYNCENCISFINGHCDGK